MTRGPILAALAVAVALCGIAGLAMLRGAFTPWIGLGASGVPGVDVSHHQGPIDWTALASDNVTFAYIKATEGATHVDPRFADNWRDAGAAGLYRGAYHFFTLCRSGQAQAANFIATVPVEAGSLPPAVDMEHLGPCRDGPTITDVIGEMRAFMEAVGAHYGARPIIYTTREFHDLHLAEIRGERFWLRSLFQRPDYRQTDWVIWQHHNRASKRGVSAPIDLNIFRGSTADLARFAGANSP